MKTIKELYPDIDDNTEIKGISINSKEISEGDLFVCTKGVSADRHDYIDEAIKNGASACLISRDVGEKSVPLIKVQNTNLEFPYLCQRFYDYPDSRMKTIGVTGTDGKTTVATIIQTLIGKDKCGYIGTNGADCAMFHDALKNTTPDAHVLYKYMDRFIKSGCKYLSIETSSEAFLRGRLTSFEFDISIFTNITSEHLNIHKTFENYFDCKKMLFRQTKKDGYCILNIDEEHYDELKDYCNGHILTYGKNEKADMRIVDYELTSKNTTIKFKYNDKEFSVTSPLLAEYNIYNLACSLLTCLVLGFDLDKLIKNISKLKIDGRMEVLDADIDYSVIVDFAHTPNAISNVLDFASSIKHNKIYVVIGSAGGRDQYKRPIIGKVCSDKADYTVFSTDDPRDEDPREICNQMIGDIKDRNNYEIILDRSKAIDKVISMATKDDIVLLLCKGNEPYQITKNGYEYYNEVEEAYRAIKLINKK